MAAQPKSEKRKTQSRLCRGVEATCGKSDDRAVYSDRRPNCLEKSCDCSPASDKIIIVGWICKHSKSTYIKSLILVNDYLQVEPIEITYSKYHLHVNKQFIIHNNHKCKIMKQYMYMKMVIIIEVR